VKFSGLHLFFYVLDALLLSLTPRKKHKFGFSYYYLFHHISNHYVQLTEIIWSFQIRPCSSNPYSRLDDGNCKHEREKEIISLNAVSSNSYFNSTSWMLFLFQVMALLSGFAGVYTEVCDFVQLLMLACVSCFRRFIICLDFQWSFWRV
jgi:hypothetical protein